jgi:hypothetical protein
MGWRTWIWEGKENTLLLFALRDTHYCLLLAGTGNWKWENCLRYILGYKLAQAIMHEEGILSWLLRIGTERNHTVLNPNAQERNHRFFPQPDLLTSKYFVARVSCGSDFG